MKPKSKLPQVDLLKGAVEKVVYKKPKRKLFYVGKFFIYFFVVLGIFSLALTFKAISSSSAITEDGAISNFFKQVKSLVSSEDRALTGEAQDRINVLLLGMGGQGHAGAYLTDTIILASIKPSTDEVAFLSIPRDLFVEIPGYGWRKINNANAFGEMDDGQGAQLITTVIENITGQDVHYYGRLDFQGFTKIVDLLGGLEIEVDRTFYDYMYPDWNYGYQNVSFEAGKQTMDGDQSLKFVRSRHGNNGEGSDFARSKRQQKVLLAFKNKILSFSTLLNPKKIIDILNSLEEHTRTDMEAWELIRLAKLAMDVDKDNIVNQVLETGQNGVLYSETTIDGAYILRPKAGLDDFSEIQKIAEDIFFLTFINKESARIEIQNGTNISGLANTTSQYLSDRNFNIVSVGNAEQRDYEKTVIYDLTKGQKKNSLEILKNDLNANVSTLLPAFLENTGTINWQDLETENVNSNLTSTEELDFIIVLGENSRSIVETGNST
ncbi:MAG: LCP family protein [Patescibacteria group bacterium]